MLEGADTPDVVLGGESHRTALLLANREDPRSDIGAAVLVRHPEAAKDNRQPYWPDFVAKSDGRVAALAWSGNQHITYFLFEGDSMELSMDGPFPCRPRGTLHPLVTETAVRTLFTPSLEPLEDVLDALKGTARAALVLGTPPPTAVDVMREKFVANGAQRNKLLRQGIDILTVTVQPDEQRVALWWLLQEMTREVAEAHGATWVPVPPTTYDDRGLLLPEYARDGTHGNAAFGGVMWGEVARVLQRAAA
jgi:hypothetical protein